MIPVDNDWQPILQRATETDSYQALHDFLKQEYQQETVYPDMYHIWQAFQWTPYHAVKVVILGQDPYHGPGQAHGLSFSVLPEVAVPPSLCNIYKELENDLGIPPADHGYLKSWAQQGVLLLNTVLTVRGGQANSHRGRGWEQLTDRVIESLNVLDHPVVFILWGKPAQAKRSLIDENRHYVLTSSHPSPLSAHLSFFGSHVFSKTNKLLESSGQTPINWQLPSRSDLESEVDV